MNDNSPENGMATKPSAHTESSEPNTIYVIDDHPLMLEAMVAVFTSLKPSAPIVRLSKLDNIQSEVKRKGEPALFSLDLRLPNTVGTEGVEKLKRLWPNVPLAVCSGEPAAQNEEACIGAGADTYIEKSMSTQEIREILAGLLNADEDDDDKDEGTSVTRRQKQLLTMIDRGLTNRKIADELNISEHTVKVHLWRMYRRMGVRNRSEATHLARTQHLI